SISVATDSAHAVMSEQEYDPWGQVRSGGVGQTNLNYTGQRLDDSGLLYYHARYYDPLLGRFVSADSIIPGQSDKAGATNPQYRGMSVLARWRCRMHRQRPMPGQHKYQMNTVAMVMNPMLPILLTAISRMGQGSAQIRITRMPKRTKSTQQTGQEMAVFSPT